MRALLSLSLLLSAPALGFEGFADTEDDAALTTPDAPAVGRIINGEEAEAEDFPAAGALLANFDLSVFGGNYEIRQFLCSSTLIAPDVVLAAAHCVDPDVINLAATFGQGEVDNLQFRWTREADVSRFNGQSLPNWPEDSVPSVDQVFHPDWDYSSMQTNLGVSKNFDISLIFLKRPLEDAELGWLPTPEEADQLAEGDEVYVVGWGQQEATSGMQAPPPGTYGFKMWGQSSIAELGKAEFQVGKVRSDVRKCHGDSGGPTFIDLDSDSSDPTRVIGVTSHAYDYTDCNVTGGVDTRVDAYLDWIDQTMRAACADGTRSWCDYPGILPPPNPDGSMGWESSGEEDPKGCDTTGSGASWLFLGLIGLLVRRRA